MKTRKGTAYFFYVIICCFLSCCHWDKQEQEILSKVRLLIKERPDSAYILLRQIPHPQKMNQQSQADYALLLTQAKERNFISHENDSLIQVAVNYYKKSEDKKTQARVYYYLGKVYTETGDYLAAIDAYLKTLELSLFIQDISIIRRTYIQLSQLYEKQELYEEAMKMSRKSYDISRSDSIPTQVITPLRDIAGLFLYLNQPDSAHYYLNQALNICEETHSPKYMARILIDIAQVYYAKGEYEKAYQFVRESISDFSEEKDSLSYLFLKGDLFYQLNRLDSANYYLLQSKESADIQTRLDSYRSLSGLERKTGNIEKSLQYTDIYLALKDSIALQKNPIAAMQLIHQSDIRQVAHQQELKVRKLTILFTVALLFFLAFGIFYFFKSRKIHSARKEELIPSCQELKYKEVLQQIEQFKQTDVYKKLCEIEVLSNSDSFKLTKAETEEIYRSIVLFFSDTIQFLNQTYPALKPDDIYCILLYSSELSTRTISTCMGISADALRNRKARIKGKTDVATFDFFFNRK